MQIPILIEPVAGNGYRATGGSPLAFTAEGATEKEAMQKLRQLIQSHLAPGAHIVALEVPALNNPWKQVEGMFKDDPMFDEWQRAISEYRRQVEEDPNIP